MSGSQCSDVGGKTFAVKKCSDLGAEDAGDLLGAFCKVTSGDFKGAVITRTGDVASLDQNKTTKDDYLAGQAYFANPKGDGVLLVQGLSAADVKATLAHQKENVSSFELCEIGVDPFKTLLTLNDGRVPVIDTKAEAHPGQLTLKTPDGLAARVVSGLSQGQIQKIEALQSPEGTPQAAEIGSCTEGLGAGYVVLPTRTSAGTPVSWTLEDLAHFKEYLGGTSNRAFFCANERDAERNDDGSFRYTIAVNTNAGYRAILRPLIEALSKNDCGPMEGVKCEAAFGALRTYAPDVETWGEWAKKWGFYAGSALLGYVGLMVVFGPGTGWFNKWFGPKDPPVAGGTSINNDTTAGAQNSGAANDVKRVSISDIQAALKATAYGSVQSNGLNFRPYESPVNASTVPVFTGPVAVPGAAPVLVPAY